MTGERVNAQLILENGLCFQGKAFGHIGNATGDIVFTTEMTGYQEMLTDPSHTGQIVVMTYPLVGNAGINLEDMESEVAGPSGLVVREKCDEPSNWRCEMSLDSFLKQRKIIGLEGIDTRALTRVLREQGAVKGIITTDLSETATPSTDFANDDPAWLVRHATCRKKYTVDTDAPSAHIAVLDLGVRRSLLSALRRNNRLTVFPAFSTADEILAENPDRIFLTNGPGDPKALPEIVETIRTLLPEKPISGVCLGHLLLALAMGCDTGRMHHGHFGANHSVKEISTGHVLVTKQNHLYGVTTLSDDAEVTYTHVNDGSVEGLRHKKWPAQSVQFDLSAATGMDSILY